MRLTEDVFDLKLCEKILVGVETAEIQSQAIDGEDGNCHFWRELPCGEKSSFERLFHLSRIVEVFK